MVDILIIGAGPIGIACALQAKKANLNYVVLEKGPLVNSLYHYPVNMTFFSTSEKLELEDIPFISKSAKPDKQEALEYYRRIATSNHLNINLFELVKSVTKKENTFEVISSKDSYQTKNVVIATGFYDIPNYLNIPGEKLDKVSHYYGDPHYYAGLKTAVIGASNSAIDAALEIYRKGGEVSLIVRKQEIGKRVKYWVRPDILNRIDEGSIKVYYSSEVKEIKEKELIMNTPNGEISVANDFVLALTGYRPNITFLQAMGISISDDKLKKPIYDEKSMETNVEGIFLAGVICGGMETHKWFIENSRIHAKRIVATVAKKLA